MYHHLFKHAVQNIKHVVTAAQKASQTTQGQHIINGAKAAGKIIGYLRKL